MLVTDVFQGDPAAAAGIAAGDIITAVNGEAVETTRDLTRKIADIAVGAKVRVDVVRDGKTLDFSVTIAKREEDLIAGRRQNGGAPERESDQLGLVVSELSEERARRMNLSETTGVVVTEVAPDGKAAEAGVEVGDVVKEINHVAVASVEDFNRVLSELNSGETAQFFIRRLNQGFVVIKVTK